MENNLKEIIKPVKIISSLENEKDIIESKSYNLSLLNEEYELIMNINNIYIEFKLIKKNIICPYYYKQKYDLKNINKLLYTFFNEIKDVYNFYDKILIKNKVKLILIEDKINLNFKNIINLDNEIEINLEFKKIKINKDDILYNLINEVNILKNKLNENKDNKMKEYINNKDNEIKNEIIKENKKIIEEKINIIDNKYNNIINKIKNEYKNKIKEFKNKQNEIISEIIKNLNLLLNEYKIKKMKEIKLKIELNDNVNLINDFKCYNINTMNNNIISNNLYITSLKSVAVYNIIKNNEILYEIAYPDNNNGYNIIIYNILLNNITNKINNAHSNDIHKIKHYYDSLSKNHLLLTSSEDKSIKIWNISSNPISNILKINNCFDGYNSSPFCMLFNKEDYFVLGGSRNKKNKYGIKMEI
jgi:WD40 repeat protein